MLNATSSTNLEPKPGFIARSEMYQAYLQQLEMGITKERILQNLRLARATFYRAIEEHEKGEKPDRLLPLTSPEGSVLSPVNSLTRNQNSSPDQTNEEK